MSNLQRTFAFYVFIIGLSLLAWFIHDIPHYAMWFGFAIAGYSVIANDSIQTLGTFLTSTKKISGYVLWLFIGGLLVLTLTTGWYLENGDISFGRLQSIPQPKTFDYLELLSPVILVLLTRWRMPVSTTFLVLSVFGSSTTVSNIILKSLLGYGIASIVGVILFWFLSELFAQSKKLTQAQNRRWRVGQFLSTTYLWVIWLMHDSANVAVYLPRQLSAWQAFIVIGYLFCVVGFIVYIRGGRIQQVVAKKSSVDNYRSATFIDLIFACNLFFLKELSNIPISTTWVFLGLLAGRELGLRLGNQSERNYAQVAWLICRDILLASVGLIISLIVAYVT